MDKKSVFNKKEYYKPFWYEWAYEGFVVSEQMHWLAREVPLNEDVKDWKKNLSTQEKNLLTHIFRFFTQADCDVACSYIDRFMPKIKPVELRMMMSSIAAREAVHIQAYSMLIDEIGMPEVEYSMFLKYQEMVDKHNFMSKRSQSTVVREVAEDIALFSAFGEGLQLFSSFVILLNFTRFGKMKGMGQIVAWSMRDESHHVSCMVKLYHQIIYENPQIDKNRMEDNIQRICTQMVMLEDNFVDMAFSEGGIEGITKEEIKLYIRYIADIRLKQLKIETMHNIKDNPLPWVDYIVNGKEHTNFFENRATDYSKGTIEGCWDDAFAAAI